MKAHAFWITAIALSLAACGRQEQPEAQQAPFVRGERKVGRNEPCPCGSGKKFKHCHGAYT